MASKQVIAAERRPVLSASFRMAVEKQVTRFVASADETLDFPSTLNNHQRNFIQEFIFKYGLHSAIVGKG
jgi:R3H domain